MSRSFSASISPPQTFISRSSPVSRWISCHSATEAGPSGRVSAARLAGGASSAKSKARSWTCRLPALAPEACRFTSSRSTTSVSMPSCASQ